VSLLHLLLPAAVPSSTDSGRDGVEDACHMVLREVPVLEGNNLSAEG